MTLHFKKSRTCDSRNGGTYLFLPITNHEDTFPHKAFIVDSMNNYKHWANLISKHGNHDIVVDGLDIRDATKGLINTDTVGKIEIQEIIK